MKFIGILFLGFIILSIYAKDARLEMLEKSLENEYIRFYPYDSLIDSQCIGHGAFGIVFKATVATSDITVAYKLIIHSDKDDFFKDFVNEVCNDA